MAYRSIRRISSGKEAGKKAEDTKEKTKKARSLKKAKLPLGRKSESSREGRGLNKRVRREGVLLTSRCAQGPT